MKRLIGCTAVLCLLALTVGCGGITSSGTLAYISNSSGTGFTVYTVNTNGTLTISSISPQTTPAAPLVLQFSANGKWAFFLDNTAQDNQGRHTGSNLYVYTRAGNGTLAIFVGKYAVNGASSLVVSPNSTYLYVSEPSVVVAAGQPPTGELVAFRIDQSTGVLSGAGTYDLGYSIRQLAMNPTGSLLFALAPDEQTVVSWTVNSSTGGVIQVPATLSVGTQPDYMVLSANGNYMYVLDATAVTLNYPNAAPGGFPGSSPQFYAYSVQANGTLLPINGQSTSPVFNENSDLLTGNFPTHPIAGATSNDSRFLFIANFGSKNFSVFKIATTSGVPTEVLGDLVTINGITTSTASPFPCAGAVAGMQVGCAGPTFVSVAKTNNAMYSIDESDGKIFQFAIDQNSGVLRSLTPGYVNAETATSNPTWITIR